MEANWLAVVEVLGTIGTFIGIVLTIIYARRSDRRRLLVYDVGPPLALATVIPDRIDHRLSIVYEREGAEPENIRGAYIRFLRLGNLGREPIRKTDLAAADPLRINVSHARVLDMAVSSVSREVIKFDIGSLQKSESTESDEVEVGISFDFFDYQDGAVIRILTDSLRMKATLLGSVVGMPQGILPIEAIGQNKILNYFGCALAVILQILAIAGALLIFRNVTGDLSSLWVLLLPIAAIFIPVIVVFIAYTLVWPKGAKWPGKLSIPGWYESALAFRRDIYPPSAYRAENASYQAHLEDQVELEEQIRRLMQNDVYDSKT